MIKENNQSFTIMLNLLILDVYISSNPTRSFCLKCLRFDSSEAGHLFFLALQFTVSFSSPLSFVHSNHGRSPPGGGLSVHRHSGGHRCAAVPPGPHWDLPLRCALLEEASHQTQGSSTLHFTLHVSIWSVPFKDVFLLWCLTQLRPLILYIMVKGPVC